MLHGLLSAIKQWGYNLATPGNGTTYNLLITCSDFNLGYISNNAGAGEICGCEATLTTIQLSRTTHSNTLCWAALGQQQWGYSAFIYGGKKVTFPIPYAVQCYGVVSQNIQTTTDFIVCAINDVDITGFWDSNGSALGIYWFAYGKQQWGTYPGNHTLTFAVAFSVPWVLVLNGLTGTAEDRLNTETTLQPNTNVLYNDDPPGGYYIAIGQQQIKRQH